MAGSLLRRSAHKKWYPQLSSVDCAETWMAGSEAVTPTISKFLLKNPGKQGRALYNWVQIYMLYGRLR